MVKRQRVRWLTMTVAGLVALAGCTAENPAYQPGPDLPEECRFGSEVEQTFEDFERPGKVDLWFVISDGEAMEDYQEALAEAIPSLGGWIREAELDARAAVSTMDATESPGLAPVIGGPDDCEDNTETVADSEDDDWIETLQCNIRQGTDGDRRPRPFEVTRQSLVDSPSSLEEFRRDDARLVTVMLSEQDDCSGEAFEDDPDTPVRNLCAWQRDDLAEVDDWIDEMRSTATVAEGFGLAAFAGPPAEIEYQEGEDVQMVCGSSLGNAYPSPRLREATRTLGELGVFESVCAFDMFDQLEVLADRLVLRDEVTLCASEPMAHEPLEVVGIDADGERRDIEFGDGFQFAGPTDQCDNGAIRLHRQGAEEIEDVEMTYCGLDGS